MEEQDVTYSKSSKGKTIKNYNSNQRILLVGEGNFSNASCLAKKFVSASNMIATSLDSRDSVVTKYLDEAWINLRDLEKRGCLVLHGVNAHAMAQHHVLVKQKFDRVVFNLPHAGFFHTENNKRQIKAHQHLLMGFFANACKILKPKGEVHVTHKTTNPYNEWEIVMLAKEAGLYLVEEALFKTNDYPGYLNKRGSGKKCNKTFHVGVCMTYKFAKLPPQKLCFNGHCRK